MTAVSPPERHASWLELFFDLVAVAGIAHLAHLLAAGVTLGGAGLFTVCFLAFWTAWMCFTVYGNVAGDTARTVPVLMAMLGLVIMTGAVGDLHNLRAGAFALAYVGVRALSVRVWRSRGPVPVVADWPVAQVTAGIFPWITSLWVDGPGRYWLWALGLALDLLITLTVSEKRMAAGFGRRSAPGRPPMTTTSARLDIAHAGERLGLFTIIVLGEGVLAVTDAMAEIRHWNGDSYATVTGALALLAGLWATTLRYGFGGIPLLSAGAVRPRTLLPLHCLTTGLLAALAAGIDGLVAAVPDGSVPAGPRWLLCGTVAALSLIGAGAHLATHRPVPAWTVAALLPGLVIPVLVGEFGRSLPPVAMVWPLALAVGAGAGGVVLAGSTAGERRISPA